MVPILAEFCVEKGIVESSARGICGITTEINSIEARPVRGGKAHRTGFAACVERAAGKGKSAQSFACGADGVDLTVRRGIVRGSD